MAALTEHDVVWVADRERFGREARVAPLSVAGADAAAVFGERTTVLTSATLKLGGDFTGIAASVGLRAGRAARRARRSARLAAAAADQESDAGRRRPVPWRGLDVGSPFDYRQQGILYVARILPPPGRDGLSEPSLAEIAELVWAAGGRTLGLFSLAARRRGRRGPRPQATAEADDPVPG